MKTLKKVLAMTLAFATAMTMFVSASASFTDQSDIKKSEAVDTLVALGIIKGNTDGSFAPDKTVTRGELAKMIYVLRTGSDDGATAYSGLSTKFTDISGYWGAPYIKYCTSMGIISGRSATKFDPNATVTGMEAAKMLLVCVGYDPAKAGLTGSNWNLNTAALSSDNHLLDDIDVNINTAISRENVAQEIFNTIDADTVTYDDNGNVKKKETTKDVTQKVATYNSDGNINGYTTVVKSQTNNETVGEKFLNLEKTIGVLRVSGNAYLGGYSDNADDDALYVVSDGNSVDEGSENAFTKVKTDYSDLLGERVKVLYKKDHTDEVYGVYAMDDQNKVVKTAVASDLDTVSGEQKIKIGDTKYKVDDDCQIYINNVNVSTIAFGKYDLGIYNFTTDKDNNKTPTTINESALAAFIDANSINNGKVIAISNDDNDKIDVLRLYTKQFAQVTSVTSKGIYVGNADCDANDYGKYTIPGGTKVISNYDSKFLFDDNKVKYYDGIANDDYVFVDYDYYADKYVITKADKVTGDLTAYTTKTTDVAEKVTINGTTYNVYDNTSFRDKPSINDEYTLYVDGTYAYAVDGDTASSLDTAVITGIDDSYDSMSKGVKATLLFSDNTTKSVVINSVSGKSVTSASGETVYYKYGTAFNSNGEATEYGYRPTTLCKINSDSKNVLYEGEMVEYDTSSNKYQITKIINGIPNFTSHKYSYAGTGADYDDDDATIAGREIADDAVIYIGYYKNDSDRDNQDMSYKAVKGSDFSNYSDNKVKQSIKYTQVVNKNDSTGTPINTDTAKNTSLFLQKESSNVYYIKLGICIMDSKLSNTGNTVYGYVTKDPGMVKNSDDDTVTQMTVWNGTKDVTLTCDDEYSKVQKGSFVSYAVVNDIATNVELKDAYRAAVSSVSTNSNSNKDYKKRLTFYNNLPDSGLNYCKLMNDSQEIYFDASDHEGEENGSIVKATDEGNGKFNYNVVVVPDESNPDEIDAIFVERDNDLGLDPYDTNGVTLNESSLALNLVDKKTATLTAKLTGDGVEGKTVTWTSNKESIATVDTAGKITAVKAGEAIITAKVNGYTATCNVTVAVDTNAVTLKDQTVIAGDNTTILSLASQTDAIKNDTNKSCTWESETTTVATIDSTTGKINAIAAGPTKITVTVKTSWGGTYTGTCTLTVNPKP